MSRLIEAFSDANGRLSSKRIVGALLIVYSCLMYIYLTSGYKRVDDNLNFLINCVYAACALMGSSVAEKFRK